MLSFLMAMLRRIKYNLSRNGVNTSAVCKRIFFIQRKAEQSDLCSDVVRVAGLEPAAVYVKIVDTSTFLRNADLHLTCIFIFISKLATYSPHISPVFQRRFSERKSQKAERKSQKAERISEAGFAVNCKNLLNLSISLDSFSLER